MSQTELKTLDDARRHNQELAVRRAADDRVPGWGRIAKRITWTVLIAGAFLAYYLLDTLQEALSLLR